MKKLMLGAVALAIVASASTASAGFLNFGRVIQSVSQILGFDTKKPGYFQVFQSPANRQFYFHLKAANHKIILQSEGYVARDGALNGMRSLVANARGLHNKDVKQAANGKWYFTWMAANYKVIGQSQTYVSKSNAQRGADAVKAVLMNNPAIPK
jgi:hypothetical protein